MKKIRSEVQLCRSETVIEPMLIDEVIQISVTRSCFFLQASYIVHRMSFRTIFIAATAAGSNYIT